MGKLMTKITESTGISVSFALIIGAWIVSVETRVNANSLMRQVDDGNLAVAQALLIKIDRRLARIEGALRIESKENEK